MSTPGTLTLYAQDRRIGEWVIAPDGLVHLDLPDLIPRGPLQFFFMAPQMPKSPAPPPRELESMSIEEVFDYLKARVEQEMHSASLEDPYA